MSNFSKGTSPYRSSPISPLQFYLAIGTVAPQAPQLIFVVAVACGKLQGGKTMADKDKEERDGRSQSGGKGGEKSGSGQKGGKGGEKSGSGQSGGGKQGGGKEGGGRGGSQGGGGGRSGGANR